MGNTILIIEDNPELSDNITSILELAHYKVLSAPNGKIGAALAQQHHPDLILCDIMMPELDGYGVLQILSSNPETINIPFIFLTAKADPIDFRTGMNLGADDYITKPFNNLDLLKVIEIRLKKRTPSVSEFSDKLFNSSKEMIEFQKLFENRPVKVFRKKELLFIDEQSPTCVFYIKNGSVKTYKINSDGKELITGMHQTGEYLGYVPLLEESLYTESAEALEKTEVIIIPKDDFLSLLYSSKEVARKFIKMLSTDLEETEKRLLDLAYQSVRQRVAKTLLQLETLNIETSKDPIITVTRRDIANVIGTAVESLNRTLSDFKDEGLIETSEEGLKILNRPKLERLLR